MKIKKCLVAATLSVGLACSAAALAPTTDVSPTARIGFILVYQSTKDLNDPVKGMVRAGATGAGAAAGTLATIWAGTKIGGSFGAFVGGPTGAIAGAAAGAL